MPFKVEPRPITRTGLDKVEIAEADFYKLPREARELIRHYGVPCRASKRDTLAFELAEYRWDEINAILNRLEGNDGNANG